MERNVADEVAARAASEHGFRHIDHFNNPALGSVLNISTPQELESHVKYVIESPDTKCFTFCSTEKQDREADIFYHEPSNTMVINPADLNHDATVYRPKEGFATFEKKLQESKDIEGKEISVVHGIGELYPEPDKTQSLIEEPEPEKFTMADFYGDPYHNDLSYNPEPIQGHEMDLADDIER